MLAKAPQTGAAPDRARTAPKPLQSYPANPSDGNSNAPADAWPEWTNEPLEELGIVLTDPSLVFAGYAFETEEGGAR